ncbi:thiamine phosphate synthase [Kroppenstedtia pulmonis]|nr:thiamine phosphate synthase [Kroppenstedtia pulmonis]
MTMFKGDMERKRKIAIQKVWDAIEVHNGQTILSTGITGDDARIAKAVVDAGVRMLEPNHPAVALARGHQGVTTMHDAEHVRHDVDFSEMVGVVKGIRSVVGEEPFITVGVPGGFTETMPVPIADEDFFQISRAGTDGLHTHKCDLFDLEQIVKKAHYYGMLVDAYIAHPDDKHPFGIPARTPEEVAKAAKQMEEIGVDMIGLMTGMSYDGVKAGEIPNVIKERLEALISSVSVPTLAEGGINTTNYQAFRQTGVHIIVVGTSIDQVVQQSAQETVKKFFS